MMMFSDASQAQRRIITTTAYSGGVVPMSPLYPNYTYTLTFPGPRLRCGNVPNQTLFDQWPLALPKNRSDNHGYYSVYRYYNASRMRDAISDIMVNPYEIWFTTPTLNVTCEVWNATYTARFTFVNSQQSTVITNIQHESRFWPAYSDYCIHGLCAYQGWHKALTEILVGWVSVRIPWGEYFEATTRIMQTTLAGCPEL
jgi:hypothetical protein